MAALAEAVAEDFQALGHRVDFAASGRLVAPVQQGLLRRALGNSRRQRDQIWRRRDGGRWPALPGRVEIRVADEGPGIPADERDRVLSPSTGWSPRAIAARAAPVRRRSPSPAASPESHGGALVLLSNSPHGLIAVLGLPAGQQA